VSETDNLRSQPADDGQTQSSTPLRTPGWRWTSTVTLTILWVFVILGAYFWAHKPLSLDTLAGLLRTVLSLGGCLLILAAAAGLGRRVTGGILRDEGAGVRLSLSLGVGFGILSLTTLALGMAGGLTRPAAWLVIALASTVSWRQIRDSWLDLRKLRLPPTKGSRFLWWAVVYAAISLGLAGLLALAPPTGWDALVYHLTGPRLFIGAGRITHTLDLPYLGFPQLGEMLFTLGMLLVGDGVPALIHYAYGLLAICLTAGLTQRLFKGHSGWFAALLLLSVPTFLSLMSQAYVDLSLLFYAVATLCAFLRWQEYAAAERETHWLLLAGLFAGLSAGVKYTAIAVPIALGLATLWASRPAGFRTAVMRLLAVAATATLVALPWLLENWLTTGNPVYPFFFGGQFWDCWRSWWYDRPGTGLATTAPWRLLTAPLEATILGVEGGSAFDATIGPLILACIPLLGAIWSRLTRAEQSRMGYVLLFFGVSYALWLVGLARSALLLQTRLLLPAFGAAAVIGGVALDRLALLRRPQLAIDWMVRVAMALALALLLFTQIGQFARLNPLPVLLGQESRADYLVRRLGTYQVAIEALAELPSASNVVFLWEPRSYGCLVTPTGRPGSDANQLPAEPVLCQPDALLDRFLHLTHRFPNAEAIADHWQTEGVTHILLYRTGQEAIVSAGFDPVTPRDLAILSDLQANHLRSVGTWNDAYTLYELSR